MFSGIIKEKVKVKMVKLDKAVLTISTTSPSWKTKKGESISVNGVCSTVSRKGKGMIGFDYMQETLRASNVSDLKKGDVVNLEPSLKFGDSIDGHFVTGHVDAVGVVRKVTKIGKSKVLSVSIPKELQKYVVYKGSVTLDGVALTISKKTKDGLEVSLIPYTLAHTNMGEIKTGERVNVECDIIAKYLYAEKRQ